MTDEQERYFGPRQSGSESPSRGKWIVGGGILAGFAWWLFGKHGAKGSGGPNDGQTDRAPDATRLVFRVLDSGVALSSAPLATMTVDAAVKRIKEGSRTDVTLVIPGSTIQRNVVSAVEGFHNAGIEVFK